MTSTPENWCTPGSDTNPQGAAKRTPQERHISVSSLCNLGYRPLMITGMIRDQLIRHFAAPSQIEEPDLRHLIWRRDERTGIVIESIYRWRGTLAEKRPAVVLKPNTRTCMPYSLGKRVGISEQGHGEYGVLWVGSHTVFCLHGSGASAEILGAEVQRELLQFSPVLVEYLGLFKFTVTEVGGISLLEESKQTFVVPVTVAWAYEENWTVERESLKLRKLPLSVLLDGALERQTL